MATWSAYRQNYIPSGQQLPRTPSLTDVKRELVFFSEASLSDHLLNKEVSKENLEPIEFKANTPDTKPDCSDSLLSGMKGYQLTENDLEFIKTLKVDKRTKHLQAQLKALQKELISEKMALELTLASREKAQAELEKFLSCLEAAKLLKLVLQVTLPSVRVSELLDAKSLLAMVTKEDVDKAVGEKKRAIGRMEKTAARLREDSEEKRQLEKQLVSDQLAIQRLMSELSDLKTKLAEQEELKCGAGASEAVQAAQGQVKQPDKSKRKPVAPKTSQPTSRKPVDEDKFKPTTKPKKTSVKSTVEKTKAGPGPQMLKDKSQPVQGTRGRQKPAGPSKDSTLQVKSGQRAGNSKLAERQEEPPEVVLRRSKRIASKR
ncbi:uncharacterized protein LOC133544103 isoform X2 [Nerophis ophidion]|uniref:uncharacterized protein LOC133544103 isoform X2 n=1 Tax=Nerophis ophidion TaxID=159077 RepID=UPI002ADF9A43|nr:uncharacterized protein LOC133544103 isoform X2 [Nerophis ophidion]